MGSKVVIACDPSLRTPGPGIDSSRLLKLLDRAVPMEVWKQVVRPGETVGLKVNCLAGRGISTRPQLVDLICERLQQAGVRQQHIVIWDRLNADLESAGFRIATRSGGIRCIGNDVLGYEEELTAFGSAASLMAKTLTQVCHVVINLPVLKDHGIVGVTMALKNLFGAIHNPNKYHMNVGDPYVADVYMLPPIRQKVRLTICDATTAQYEGGPSYMPQWTWPYNGLIVSQDPVALDHAGWQIIERKRAEQGMKPLKDVGREPRYIATAAGPRHRLGALAPQVEFR
ncbi:MAG: DUF362 domain-containing protein [Acidobacteriota bacterium]